MRSDSRKYFNFYNRKILWIFEILLTLQRDMTIAIINILLMIKQKKESLVIYFPIY